MSNSLKVWLFLISTTILILISGYYIGERQGLFIGFLLALGINYLLFFFGESHLLSQFQAVEVEGQDAWGLNNIVRHYARKAGIPKPRVYIIAHANPVAFALGRSLHHSAITLSLGLIERLSSEQIEAIVALQTTQIRSLDTFAFGMSSTLANAILGFAKILDSMWLPKYFSRSLNWQPFGQIFAPVAWLILRLSINPLTYYQNDLQAAELLEKPNLLAETLWRLDAMNTAQPMKVPLCTEHLFVVSPNRNEKKLITHPSVEQRIRKLIGYYPI